jgi:hypothetical protein
MINRFAEHVSRLTHENGMHAKAILGKSAGIQLLPNCI